MLFRNTAGKSDYVVSGEWTSCTGYGRHHAWLDTRYQSGICL